MPIIPVFPNIIHGIEIKDFNDVKDKLIDFVYDEYKKDSGGLNKSNEGGWHSHTNFHDYENCLSDFIIKSLNNYFPNSNVFVEEFQYRLQGLWININGNGGYNKSHVHPGSDMSGVFWIKLPKNSGGIVFQNSSYFNRCKEIDLYNEQFRKDMILYPEYRLFPGEGMMALFPSSLYHCVETNRSDEDRISLSFNIEFG